MRVRTRTSAVGNAASTSPTRCRHSAATFVASSSWRRGAGGAGTARGQRAVAAGAAGGGRHLGGAEGGGRVGRAHRHGAEAGAGALVADDVATPRERPRLPAAANRSGLLVQASPDLR